jgi:hypothetical protein
LLVTKSEITSALATRKAIGTGPECLKALSKEQ